MVGISLIVEFYEQIVAYAKSFGREVKINEYMLKRRKKLFQKLKH